MWLPNYLNVARYGGEKTFGTSRVASLFMSCCLNSTTWTDSDRIKGPNRHVARSKYKAYVAKIKDGPGVKLPGHYRTY